jgi:hypothetical protein
MAIRRVLFWISKTTHANAHANDPAPTPKRTCTHSYTHTDKYVRHCCSTATMIREGASMRRYTHIACLVLCCGGCSSCRSSTGRVCLTVCDIESSKLRRPRSELGSRATEKSHKTNDIEVYHTSSTSVTFQNLSCA